MAALTVNPFIDVFLRKHATDLPSIKVQALLPIFFIVVSLIAPSLAQAEQALVDIDKTASTEGNIKTNDNPWRIWKSDSRQSVSFRQSKHGELVEIKATATLESTITGFLLFIQDTTNIPNWLDNVEYSIVLKQFSEQENLFLNKFKGLLMVSDRDMVVRSRYWQNQDNSVEIAVTDASQEVELTKNAIRMKVLSAHWRITPIANEDNKPLIEIEYVFTVDPMGSLPLWIHKKASLSGIWKTLNNLQQQLPSSIWQDKVLTAIDEPSYLIAR